LLPYVPGTTLAEKPVLVLTSKTTLSSAEEGDRIQTACRALYIFCIVVSATLHASDAPLPDLSTFHHLRLYHTHTGEYIDIVYRKGNAYIPGALEKLDYFLRDHRTGTVHHFDPRLFDLLDDLTISLGRPETEIDVVCGYRTAWSNNYLRSRSSAVAKHSLHMKAIAIDIRIPGVSTSELRDTALRMHRGGVGYYPREEFVHVDVGRVRRW
jgi:uncharacterized protein YcbK (DUF882 family)